MEWKIIAALRSVGVQEEAVVAFAAPLAALLPAFGIGSRERLAAFLGQCHVESVGFRRLVEDLNYRTPERLLAVWPSRFAGLAAARAYVASPERLANHVYAGRLGNGDTASGDGWRYRGRGLKQLTGRDNYRRAAQALGRPYVEQPDLLCRPEDAVRTAAWFWAANGCNPLADAGDIDAITRRVNGPAMLQAATRRQLAARLAGVL